MQTVPARLLGDAELIEVERLLDADPFGAAQVAERVEAAGLSWYHQDGRIFGYRPRRTLRSLCWVGVNIVPVRADEPALDAFAEVLSTEPRSCSSIVGSADGVLGLWQRLQPRWAPHRDLRPCQPLLATRTPAPVVPDPDVRLVQPHELDLVYPAAVAMYTEEVGVSPLVGGGGPVYRARIRELVTARRTYARVVNRRVVFKAELGLVTRHTAQIQGVWTAPDWRGHGIATRGIAAVVEDVLDRVAPTVSLYVNDFNVAARTVYRRCGFQQVGTFATVLF